MTTIPGFSAIGVQGFGDEGAIPPFSSWVIFTGTHACAHVICDIVTELLSRDAYNETEIHKSREEAGGFATKIEFKVRNITKRCIIRHKQ